MSITLKSANVQFVFPRVIMPEGPIAFFPPLPPHLPAHSGQTPVPVPLPMVPVIGIMPIPVLITETTTTTTTTTTTLPPDCGEPDNPVFPISVPFGLQIAMSALRPPTFCMVENKRIPCPPCPPCVCAPACTPSFFSFCSSCHLKCRCREGMDVPTPIPPIPPVPVRGPAYPLPVGPVGLPPALIAPYPPYPKIFVQVLKGNNDQTPDESSDDQKRYRRLRKSHHKHYRRLKKLSRIRIPPNSHSKYRHRKYVLSKTS